MRRWLGPIAVLVAALAAGCGGSEHPSSTTTTTSTTPRVTAEASTARASDPAFSYLPSALVTMRQFSPESLLWQTVSVQPSGRAQLTTIIGEISGATRKRFALPSVQTARLRRLVAAARAVAPPTPSDPRATLYTLTLPGRPAENLQGTTPPALSALTGYLSGLMFTYCC